MLYRIDIGVVDAKSIGIPGCDCDRPRRRSGVHLTAFSVFRDARREPSQSMLALMVSYNAEPLDTAQPIVEPNTK